MKESITVSALNRYTKALIETDEVLSQVWVEGEISGLKIHHSTGHMYFTLKDSEACVAAVMFKSYADRLRFVVKDGMYIVARCKVSLYERDGKFQIYVEDITPKGVGTLQQQLEALKEKLLKEGLFSDERKRPLVAVPKKIGVITSSGAAALQDMINVISRRYPFTTLTLFPASVQGQLAVPTIIDAINSVNERDDIDEVIIARGGGSKEDLFVFNDERLVRAAATLKVPFISAVGHETDFSLLDFVADRRAATPSVAAELAVPDSRELFEKAVGNLCYIKRTCERRIKAEREAVLEYREGFSAAKDSFFDLRYERLERSVRLLDSLNPAKVLTRGYAAVEKSGSPIGRVSDIITGDRISVRFSDGKAECTVTEVLKEKYEI